MAELVDAADSKSVALKRRVGSIPSPGTIYSSMNFCSNCGNPVVLKVPEGDFLPRHVCDRCGTIHYLNPKVVVGSVPEYQGRILICKRGIEPRRGFWTIPAGFMENDETLEAGAAREAREEARIDVEIGSLLLLANVVSARQVHVFFRARLTASASAVATWPSTRPLAEAQALTRCSAALPRSRSCDRRAVLPSIATIPAGTSGPLTLRTQARKQARNSSGSSRAKTRPKVSCDGMPPGSARKVRSQASFAWPNVSIATATGSATPIA